MLIGGDSTEPINARLDLGSEGTAVRVTHTGATENDNVTQERFSQ